MNVAVAIRQGGVDALPYSSGAAAVTYFAGGSSFETGIVVLLTGTVWLVLTLLLTILSANRYRADGTWLPITRGVLYHGFTVWP
jgi:hypothetical protein